MNKSQLVSQVAGRADLSRREAAATVETFIDQVRAELKAGGEARLQGLGVFEVVRRAAKVARNLRTGEQITVPARRVVRFRAGRRLRDAVGQSAKGKRGGARGATARPRGRKRAG